MSQVDTRDVGMDPSETSSALKELVDGLAAFEPIGAPVLSLYLDARPDEHGKDHFQPFLRKELAARSASFGPHTLERESFDRDADRIQDWVRNELRRAANGVALFCCSEADLFEAVQLEAPVGESRLHVAPEPHIYPLVRMLDRYPRYAALVADTNLARLFVFGLLRAERERTLTSPKTTRTRIGGWSQMRYQRHVDDQYRRHAKEVVSALERTLRDEGIDQVVLAGDEVIVPLLRSQLPPFVADKVVDILPLAVRAPEHEVLSQTLAALRRRAAETDVERVGRLFDDYRAGGLGVVGLRATEAALERGQAHELLLTSDPATLREIDLETAPAADPPSPATTEQIEWAGRLVRLARKTDTAIRMIEDRTLLANAGGAGATLRYLLALPTD